MATPEIARRTLSHTTRSGIRLTAHSSMSRRFCTNDRHMHYKRLHHNKYIDTTKASIPSRLRDLYVQAFVTDFKWARAFPIKNKSEAVHALDLLLHCEGVPEKMIVDADPGQVSQDMPGCKYPCQAN